MIDVTHTTLVPSLTALHRARDTGDIGRLVDEYNAERLAVAQAIGRPPADITVTLSPGARDVTLKQLNAARTKKPALHDLVGRHIIHPCPHPRPSHRVLEVNALGQCERDGAVWLWLGSEELRNIVNVVSDTCGAAFTTPSYLMWPVSDAIAFEDPATAKAVITDLAHTYRVVDVDDNGRPLPVRRPTSTTPER